MLKGQIVYRAEKFHKAGPSRWGIFRWRVTAAGHKVTRLERVDEHPQPHMLNRMSMPSQGELASNFAHSAEEAWACRERELTHARSMTIAAGLRHEGADDALEKLRSDRERWEKATAPPDDEHAAVESHTCPVCEQEPGELCVTLGAGKLRGRAHEDRIELARRARA